MKTTFRVLMLGTALSLTGCPSDSKPDANPPPVAVNPTAMNPAVTPPPPPPPLTAEDKQKALYGFGALIAERTPVKAAEFNEEDLAEVIKGMKDAATNGKELAVKLDEYGPKVEQLLNEKQALKAEAEKKKGADFLAKAAKEKGAQKMPSGLIYIETLAGKGKSPVATDTVSVHYKGTTIDEKEFDSSYKRGQPTEFPLNGVIKCWTEGVAKMKVGGKAKLVCPSDIAYGDKGAGSSIPGGATLVFEVELISIKDPAAAPPAPAVPNLGVPPQGK